MSILITCLLGKHKYLLPVMCIRHRSQRKNLGKPPGIAKTLDEKLKGKLIYLEHNVIFKTLTV